MSQTPLHSITPFTMLDFPDLLACIFWFSWCNLECPYCYNPEFLREQGKLSLDDALAFLSTRKGLLEGVVYSGGEASFVPQIAEWMHATKNLGYKIKLDTNGTNPKRLKSLIEQGLLDYIALDFKGSSGRFFENAGRDLYSNFIESLDILIDSGVKFEVRTTVHSKLLGLLDLEEMARVLREHGYLGEYYLQRFVNDKETLKQIGESMSFPAFNELSGVKIVWR
ncbi:MAG: anaerobic ribonucleoside-triphosphate reductase activating protein [Wolinella sp.]